MLLARRPNRAIFNAAAAAADRNASAAGAAAAHLNVALHANMIFRWKAAKNCHHIWPERSQTHKTHLIIACMRRLASERRRPSERAAYEL